ncbi:hypothetical protein [Streptomyces sp. NPDC048669]|uniref:hypothetical protein n=1 Tax=Streptomyces sp. NPDC048669 TaxID=3155267 RepID=UPI00344499F4
MPALATPAPAPPVRRKLRGARFGGAPGVDEDPAARGAAALDPVALKSAQDTVAALLRLRTEGCGGEAHGVLCEAAGLPADRLPVLAAELRRDAARIAEGDPRSLVPRLLAAARGVSGARERDVVHALRVAGIGQRRDLPHRPGSPGWTARV